MSSKSKSASVLQQFSPVPTTETTFEEELSENNDDVQCGIGRFKPRWLQRFANPKVYLINFCLLGFTQGAYFTYLIGILSTIEKRFAFESKITGLILIADNLSPIFTSFLIGHFGGSGHRPRWIAAGMFITAVSCFVSASPYFFFGAGVHLLDRSDISLNNASSQLCEISGKECIDVKLSSTIPAVSLFFTGSFLLGFGAVAYYSIGTPYLDDNVAKKDSPLYFAVSFALRLFGPAIGFLLSSACLRLYENPTYDPGFGTKDPRWIGAWWLGFVILGLALILFTLPICLFPRRLPRKTGNTKAEKARMDHILSEKNKAFKEKLKELPKALLRLFKNPMLMCHTLGSNFRFIAMFGFYISMPRYVESQFRQSASSASFYSGTISIFTMLIGILGGGAIIRKFKPRPKYLTGYMFAVEVIGILGLLASMFIGCTSLNLAGSTISENGIQLENSCNSHCGCTTRVFKPVCGPDGVSNYFSPCFAGCTGETGEGKSIVRFHKLQLCSKRNEHFSEAEVTSKYCPFECGNFVFYIVVLCIGKMISATARVGNTLVTLRCVEPKDKSLALGVLEAFFCLFAFIPYPLIYGAIVDSSCLVWEETCGETGNCWIYDSEKFRYSLHGASLAFLTLSVIFDFLVFLLSSRLKNFYSEDDGKESQIDKVQEELTTGHLGGSNTVSLNSIPASL
ncbi:solute carrier organic anion transporter family member 4C1-like [Limulus polyphemus]|uniref:Solute carrier organic anion transporter family member n=1 Tax=Limulus polyphemus TaxID=6850 RepID=A0ABM1SMS5_LIMPO|nr:solute carrier organic anion transporter family member 4C1-like [Limulus polyphemus]